MTINAFAVLRHAIYSVARNMYAAFVLSWPWLIIFGFVYAAAFYSILQSGFGTTPLDPEQGFGTFALWVIVGGLVYLFGFASVAVNWHRYVLLDEVPMGMQRLRLDRHVRRYAARLLMISVLTGLIMIVPMFLMGLAIMGIAGPDAMAPGPDGGSSLGIGQRIALTVLSVIIVALLTAVFFRSSLALPAAALGRDQIGIGESWRRTQGNFGQLLLLAGGSAVLQVAAQLLLDGFAFVFAAADSTLGFSLLIALTVMVTWFFTFLGITLLTSLYGHLVEQRPL